MGWMPRRRELCKLLIPQHDFSRREPQQFGMISLTEIEPWYSAEHRAGFGNFGIVVSSEWTTRHKAQRVVYVDPEGPFCDALKSLFQIGYLDLQRKIEYPDDAVWLMAFENKQAATAVAHSPIWSGMLQIWEYLEPASSAAQREWRIVNALPLYSLKEDRTKAVAEISPPQGWAKVDYVVPLVRQDVQALVCPAAQVFALREILPECFRGIEVIELSD